MTRRGKAEAAKQDALAAALHGAFDGSPPVVCNHVQVAPLILAALREHGYDLVPVGGLDTRRLARALDDNLVIDGCYELTRGEAAVLDRLYEYAKENVR